MSKNIVWSEKEYKMIVINRLGLQFKVNPHEDGGTIIELIGTVKSLKIKTDINSFIQSWNNWIYKGAYIQTVFQYLNNDEREFLLTGITPNEWKEMFKDAESND